MRSAAKQQLRRLMKRGTETPIATPQKKTATAEVRRGGFYVKTYKRVQYAGLQPGKLLVLTRCAINPHSHIIPIVRKFCRG